MRKMMMVFALASTVAVCGARSLAQMPADRATMDDLRSKLLRLPYFPSCCVMLTL